MTDNFNVNDEPCMDQKVLGNISTFVIHAKSIQNSRKVQ